MSKITSDHLSHEAIIYVHQSTMQQVFRNPGSREWQHYGLKDRAGASWRSPPNSRFPW